MLLSSHPSGSRALAEQLLLLMVMMVGWQAADTVRLLTDAVIQTSGT